MDEIWKLTEDTLRNHCRVQGPITADSHFRSDLGLDSLALLNLAVAAEDHFRICLDEDPENPPARVGEFVALVSRRLREEGRIGEP